MTPQRIPDPMVPAVNPGHPDATLVEAWTRRIDLLWPMHLEEIDLEKDEDVDRYCEPITDLEIQIMDTPAHTVVGLLVKLRLLREYEDQTTHPTAPWRPLDPPTEAGRLDQRTLFSVTSDALRLAMAGEQRLADPAGDPVVALVTESKERRREYLPYSHAAFGTPECEKGEALSAKVGGTECALLEATPTTPEGIALLWQFLEIDIGDHDPHQPALRNLRRALGQMGVRCLDHVRDDVTQIGELCDEGAS